MASLEVRGRLVRRRRRMAFDALSPAPGDRVIAYDAASGAKRQTIRSDKATRFGNGHIVFDGETVDASSDQVTIFSFIAGPNQTTLTFGWNDPGNPNADPDRILSGVALVSLGEAPIPEPATFALLGLGGLAMLRRRRSTCHNRA